MVIINRECLDSVLSVPGTVCLVEQHISKTADTNLSSVLQLIFESLFFIIDGNMDS